MFDKSFPFQKVARNPPAPNEQHVKNKEIYRFKSDSKQNRYLVHVHEYEHKVFVVKFHLTKHKDDPKKYHFISNYFECPQVLRTVIDICLEKLQEEELASFAFIGVPKPEEKTSPSNQRFRVYKSLSETFLGPETFKHVVSAPTNSYILINKKNANHEELATALPIMFGQIYQDLAELLNPPE